MFYGAADHVLSPSPAADGTLRDRLGEHATFLGGLEGDDLARAGLAAVADRTWDRALARLAAGYRAALRPARVAGARHAA